MAVIQLASREVTQKTVKYGTASVSLPAGRHLKVETSPGGEEMLDVTCPAGKTWAAQVTVEIVETNV